MKLIRVLLALFFITLPLKATDTPLAEIGDQFCCDVIDAMAMGSLHVMDCLITVEKLIEAGVSDQESLVMGICKESPNFHNEVCTEQECLASARESNYLK